MEKNYRIDRVILEGRSMLWEGIVSVVMGRKFSYEHVSNSNSISRTVSVIFDYGGG